MTAEAQNPGPAAGSRLEHDLVGDRWVPADALYGVHALRGAENFARLSAQLLRNVPELCRAFAMVKLAAARANVETGAVPAEIGEAIIAAAQELIDNSTRLSANLIVPVVQGGAGTSTNMNVNEVLANRALELMGHSAGEYQYCHPNDHVNRSQSTNDVYPTAMRLALVIRARELETAQTRLAEALRNVAANHADTTKLGRTQLQDAVAMSVGDEFSAWANAIDGAGRILRERRGALLEVNLGGTAIGTGLTASDEYRARVVPLLAEISGEPVKAAQDAVSATTDTNALLGYSAALRGLAVSLAKIANDLRLLASGPVGGLAELQLPTVQAGSSMMPGKVNPVIAEFVNQLAFRVRGGDATVTAALDAAQLQLNAMLPVVASTLLNGQRDLMYGMEALRTKCIDGIVVNQTRTAALARHDLGELSTMAASNGYALATSLALQEQESLVMSTLAKPPATPDSDEANDGTATNEEEVQ
jgi:aspartate ammonia-lyase